MFKTLIERTSQAVTRAVAKVTDIFKATEENSISKVDEALYQFLMVTKLYILLPTLGIAITIYLVKEYLAYVVLFSIAIFALIKWLTPVEYHVDHDERYINIRDTLYIALESIPSILPVKRLQSVIDIVHQPTFVPNGGHAVYLYKLQKTTYEHLDKEKLDFAQKIMQAEIDKHLNIYEYENLDGSTYYKDLRLITITKIIDFGTHYQLQVLCIDNDVAYNTALKQLNHTNNISQVADTKDGDF